MEQLDRLEWSWTTTPRYLQERQGLFGFGRSRAHAWQILQGEGELVAAFTAGVRPQVWAFVQTRELSQDDTLLNSLLRIVGSTLLKLDRVKSVYMNFDEEAVNVWTVLFDASEENRRKVYQAELGLIDSLPGFIINFRTTDQTGEHVPASSDYRCLTK